MASIRGGETVVAGVEDPGGEGGSPPDGAPDTNPEDDAPTEGMSPAGESSSDPVMSPDGEHRKCPSPCPVSGTFGARFVPVASTTSTALEDMLVGAGDNIC